MIIKRGFVVRDVGGEHFAVPIGEMAKQFHGMIKLNDTALFLWNSFSSDITRDEAVKALTDAYEVELDEAERGVDSFISMALGNGFME